MFKNFFSTIFKVDEAKVISSEGEKVFKIGNDQNRKTVKKGQTITLKFMADYDQNAGSNLIDAKFQGKDIDLGLHLLLLLIK